MGAAVWIYTQLCALLTTEHRLVIQRTQQQIKLRKKLAGRQERTLDNFVLVSCSFSATVLGVLMSVMFWRYGIPEVKATFWPWITLDSVIQFIGLIEATAAFKTRANLSSLVSLGAGLPAVQSLLGLWWRGEVLSALQWFGIALVCGGLWLDRSNAKPVSGPQAAQPVPVASKWWLARAYTWTQATPRRQYTIALATWPFGAFALKPALASISSDTPAKPFLGAFMLLGIMVILAAALCLCVQRISERRAGKRQPLKCTARTAAQLVWQDIADRTTLVLFGIGGVIVGAQQFFDLMAYAIAKVAVVASLTETQIVYNIPLSLLFPKVEQWLTRLLRRQRSDPGPEPETKLRTESDPDPAQEEGLTLRTGVAAGIVTLGALLIGNIAALLTGR